MKAALTAEYTMPRQEAWLRIVTCRIEDGTQFMCTWTAWSGPVGGSA